MRVRLLGPVAVEVDGEERSLGGARQRAILARLALAAGHVVTTDRLIDELWPEEPPRTARNTVQRFISDLRRAFEPGGERLVSVDGGYRLDLAPDELDVTSAEALAASGRAALAGDNAAGASRDLSDALRLFVGPRLDGVGDVQAVEAERARLDELYLSLVEDRTDAELALGRHAGAVGDLERLIEEHPFRERLWGQLMLALYRSGRQADALRVYQRLRTTLADELGIDPSPELQDLEAQLLEQRVDTAFRADADVTAPLHGYELLEEIGRGPRSTVYRARQPATDRTVALKILDPEVADDPDFVRDFGLLISGAATVENPHVVPLFDGWREPSTACLVMRFMEGGNLSDRPPESRRSKPLASNLRSALIEAHRRGVTHGAIHARNVLFDGNGLAYLSDFGARGVGSGAEQDMTALARLLEDDPARQGRTDLDQPTALNPYKGLRAFHEVDADDFFGREAATTRLIQAVAARRLVVVVGPSGVGKSSVVRAGLVPALRRGAIPGSEKSYVVDMIPGTSPFGELATALKEVAVGSTTGLVERLAGRPNGIVRTVDEILPSTESELVVIVDQFEELFTLTTSERVRTRFIDALVGAVEDPNSRIRVIATLRADFFDRPLRYPKLGELVRAGTETVVGLAPAELERAITGPANRAGLTVEPELVAEMIADVAEHPNALPLLQYALTELVARAPGEALTVDAYDEAGGVLGALAKQADAAYLELDNDGRTALTQIMLRLVSPGEDVDTRRRAKRTELTGLAARADVVDQVLDALGRHRLLTFDRDPTTREPTVEVAHEALLTGWPRLRHWLDQHRDSARLQRRVADAAREWRDAESDDGYLLSGSRLAQIEATVDLGDLALSVDERQYVVASARARDVIAGAAAERDEHERTLERRASRRLRVIAAVLAGAALVATALTVLAVGSSREANDQRDLARASERQATLRGIAATATAELQRDPSLGLLLALEAADLAAEAGDDVPPDVVAVLHAGLEVHRVVRRFEPALSATMTSDGRFVLAGGPDERVRLFDLETGALLSELDGHRAPVSVVAVASDGARFAAGAGDGAIRVWDADTQLGLATMIGHDDEVDSLAFSPDGERLLSGSVDGTYRLWDVATGAQIAETRLSRDVADRSGFAWSGDGSTIWALSFGSAGRVAALDPETLDARPDDVTETGSPCAVAASPAGPSLAIGQFETTVSVLAGADSPLSLVGHGAPVCAVAFSADGARVASGSWDATARIWDADTGAEVMSLAGHDETVTSVAFHPNGSLVLTAAEDGTALLWDTSPSGAGEILTTTLAGAGFPHRIAVAGGGDVIVTASTDLSAIDLGTGDQIWVSNQTAPVLDLAVSPDGTLGVVAGSGGGLADVFDVIDGDSVLALRAAGPAAVVSAAFSPDGRGLAGGGADGQISLWDLASGELTATLDTRRPGDSPSSIDEMGVWRIDFTDDGRYLVAGRADGTITVWDSTELSLVHSIEPIENAILNDLELSTDLGLIAVVLDQGPVRLFQIETGEATDALPVGAGGQSLAFSPVGDRLAVGAADGTTTVWDVAERREVFVLDGPDAVTGVAFDDDGRQLATIDLAGTVRVRLLDNAELVALARERVGRELTAIECRRYLSPNRCS